MIKALFVAFCISLLPLVELRGAIPVGVGMAQAAEGAVPLPFMIVLYGVCLAGNMLPVPFIFCFARKFLEWGADKKIIGSVCRFFLEKGRKAGRSLQKKAGRGLYVALFLFVGIPVPGTGAWTGTLAAGLLDLDGKKTCAAVAAGVLLAGIIMMAVSFGAAQFF